MFLHLNIRGLISVKAFSGSDYVRRWQVWLWCGLIALVCHSQFRFWFRRSGGNEGWIAETAPSVPFHKAISILLRLIIRWNNHGNVTGTENLPARGPYIICANHGSHFDGFIMTAFSRLPVHIMVAREGFEIPLMGWFMRKALAFPVDRSRTDAGAVRKALRVLKDGDVLGLFPQGTRSVRGLVRPFKPGAIRVAVKTRSPIVPAFFANNHLMGSSFLWPKPVPLHVAFGPVIDVAALLESGLTEIQIQDLLFKAVCDLGRQLTGRDVADASEENEAPGPRLPGVG